MVERYSSVLLLSRFQSELDRLVREALEFADKGLEVAEWQPMVDVYETPKVVIIQAEVPGISSQDLTVEIEGSVVTLRGFKRTPGPNPRPARFQCMERGHGHFVRQIQLFRPVNTHRGTARLAAGVLTIQFPKIEDQRRQVHVLTIQDDEA